MEINNLYKTIGIRIKNARFNKERKQLNLNDKMPKRFVTQSELAKQLNISFQQIQKYEKAINKIPLDKLIVISKYLNKDLNYFISENVEENNVYPN
tara:strand:+ start:1158 stop:1445 length:288 start_codon:yes stop_codon:yes gene_type:complete